MNYRSNTRTLSRSRPYLPVAVLAAVLFAHCLPVMLTAQKTARPAEWAKPLTKPGLPNLHQVTPQFYRGAQPSAQGMKQLHKLGIKTVINLRALHSDRDEIGSLPLRYEHIHFEPFLVEHDEVIRFLRIATDKSAQPIFLHCQHGADRTGMLTALYRIVVQGWSKERAITEMKKGGYGFHAIWQNLVQYIRRVNVAQLKADVVRPAGK